MQGEQGPQMQADRQAAMKRLIAASALAAAMSLSSPSQAQVHNFFNSTLIARFQFEQRTCDARGRNCAPWSGFADSLFLYISEESRVVRFLGSAGVSIADIGATATTGSITTRYSVAGERLRIELGSQTDDEQRIYRIDINRKEWLCTLAVGFEHPSGRARTEIRNLRVDQCRFVFGASLTNRPDEVPVLGFDP